MIVQNSESLQTAQVKWLYSRAPTGLFGTLLNAVILVYILSDVVHHTALATWFVCMLLLSLARFVTVLRYRRVEGKDKQSGYWSRLYGIGTCLSGILWGSTAFVIFPTESLVHQVFVAFILGGLVAGSVAMYASDLVVSLVFNITALSPIIIRFFAQESEISITMGALATLFMIIMAVTVKRTHNDVMESLKLRFENVNLISSLQVNEQSLAKAQEVANLGSWEWDIVDNKLQWSDELYRIFSLTPKELGATYEAFLEYVHPDDRELFKKSVFEAMFENKPLNLDHRIVLPDSSERVVHSLVEVGFDDKNEPVQVHGIIQDITKRKKMESVIFRLADIPRDDPDPIVEINTKRNTIQYLNPAGRHDFPELDPGHFEDPKQCLFVNWDHPLLTGLKPFVDKLVLDGESIALHVSKASIGKPGQDGYKVYGRQIRYLRKEDLIRLYTIDMTREEELLIGTRQLLAEVDKIRMELENEHHEAEQIGKLLLRQEPINQNLNVNVEVEPSSKASGDRAGFIYEVKQEHGEEIEWLVVFDASGHGKGASKFQEIALGGLLALLRMEYSIKKALDIVNTTLEKLGTHRFLVGNIWRVMSAEEKKAESGWVWIKEFNIAQHHVLELDSEEQKVKEWEWPIGETSGRTLPMAMFDDGFENIKAKERMVRKGSRIITYTDGITEAMNIKNEQFGITKLKDLLIKTRNLSPKEAHMAIVKSLKCWATGLPANAPVEEINKVNFEDDITLAIVDIKSETSV